jgi:hypothetical protein
MNVKAVIDEMWELSGDLLNPHVEVMRGGERFGTRTGTLSSELSEDQISQKLGFEPERFGVVVGLKDKVLKSIETDSIVRVDAQDSGIGDVTTGLLLLGGVMDVTYKGLKDGTFLVKGLFDRQPFNLNAVCNTYSPHKVTVRWRFKASVDGGPWHQCGIWDYKGSRFSTGGEHEVFQALFGNHYTTR